MKIVVTKKDDDSKPIIPPEPRYRMSAVVTVVVKEAVYGLEQLIGDYKTSNPPVDPDNLEWIVEAIGEEFGEGPTGLLMTLMEYFGPEVEAEVEIERMKD